MKRKSYLLAIGLLLSTANIAMAQTTEGKKNTNLLADKIAGKLTLTGNVGYIYGFGNDSSITSSKGASAVGYGASLGWIHKSGLGLSMDYLRFGRSWQGTGANGFSVYNYDSSYNILNLNPNYRFALDKAEHWGLRLGLGLGLNIANLSYKNQATNLIIGGAIYMVMGYKFTKGNSAAPVESYRARPDVFNNDVGISLSIPSIVSGIENKCGYFTDSYRLSPDASSGSALIFYDDKNPKTKYTYTYLQQNSASTTILEQNKCYSSMGGHSKIVDTNGIDVEATYILQNPTDGFSDSKIADWIETISDQELENTLVLTQGEVAPEIAAAYERRLGKYNGNKKSSEGASWGFSVQGAAATTNTTERALGFVLSPQVAVEYDNGLLHTDLSFKYMHAVTALNHKGTTSLGAPTTYTIPSGPMALFIGAGLGLNF